jgi:hypothetical protein
MMVDHAYFCLSIKACFFPRHKHSHSDLFSCWSKHCYSRSSWHSHSDLFLLILWFLLLDDLNIVIQFYLFFVHLKTVFLAHLNILTQVYSLVDLKICFRPYTQVKDVRQEPVGSDEIPAHSRSRIPSPFSDSVSSWFPTIPGSGSDVRIWLLYPGQKHPWRRGSGNFSATMDISDPGRFPMTVSLTFYGRQDMGRIL